MCRPAHLLSHMFWFNLVQQKSNQLNIQSSNDNLTIHDKGRCKPRHRKQVVQGHMKPQQSSCSPWKEPKDCQKKYSIKPQHLLTNEEVHVVPWRFTPSNLHSTLKFAQFLFVPSSKPDPSQTVCAIGLSKATVVRDKKKAWPRLQSHISLIRPCGHANYYH